MRSRCHGGQSEGPVREEAADLLLDDLREPLVAGVDLDVAHHSGLLGDHAAVF